MTTTTARTVTPSIRRAISRRLRGDLVLCSRCWPFRWTVVDPDTIAGADGVTCGRHGDPL